MSRLSSKQIAELGLQEVVRSTPVAIVVIDAPGRVIHSNPRARELTAGLGFEMPTDLDSAIDIFHPDGRRYERHEWPAVRSITAGEDVLDEEFFYVVAGGARLWMLCRSSPIRDDDGEIVAAVLAQTDITERKVERARLAYLASLVDNTEDAIVAFDVEALAGLVEVHRARAVDCVIDLQITGEPPPDVVGKHGTEILRIVGEALTNARRHSGARHIRVDARSSESGLCVEVTDDGRGFDPAAEPSASESAGLHAMRERSALLGGDLEIHSAPATGTTIRFKFGAREHRGAPVATARVLLVDDHTAVREAIAGMLDRQPDLHVVAQAGSLAEARGMLEGVDVAVIDLGLPDGYGGELIRQMRAVNPRAQALVLGATLDPAERLGATLDPAEIARAISDGAAGTVDKAAHLEEVVEAVRRLRRGETLVPVEQLVALLRVADRRHEQERDDRRAIETLTPREREVLQGLADGLDSQAIAWQLHIAVRTERNHIANILLKLGVHTQLQALVFALRYQLVEIR